MGSRDAMVSEECLVFQFEHNEGLGVLVFQTVMTTPKFKTDDFERESRAIKWAKKNV